MARKRSRHTADDEVVIGIDPHKHTLTATALNAAGAVLACAHFPTSGEGHQALETWAGQFGTIRRWGIEGASGYGRHTTVHLTERGDDVRDVCPTRTAERARRHRSGKNDALDSERIARETLAHADLPRAFKRAGEDRGPDPVAQGSPVTDQAPPAAPQRG